MLDRPPGDMKRTHWPVWVKALIALVLLAYAVVVVWATGRYALRPGSRVVWEESRGQSEALKDFCVLAFPAPGEEGCAAGLASVNRAMMFSLEELDAPQLEVRVGGKAVEIGRECVALVPSTATWEALVANLNRDMRMWGPKESSWLSVRVTAREIRAGEFEVEWVRRGEKGYDTFTYRTDGEWIAPMRWESLAGAMSGVSSAGIALLVFAAHCTLATMILVWWALRRRSRKKAVSA